MIANITDGKNFYGAANYNQKKVDKGIATILHVQNLRHTSPHKIQQAFEKANRSKVGKPVFHVSLSFSATDKGKLDNEKMLKITQDYLREMGYEKQPYIVYRHNDTAHPHVHILTSRVDVVTQTKLPHAHERRKSKRITDELELKYDLTLSDKQVLAKREMVRDLKKVMYAAKPESLKMVNKALSIIHAPIRARSTGKGMVYFKVEAGKENQNAPSVKSALFKADGLDKKSLEAAFARNRKDRLDVRNMVEKVLAKSPKIKAITYARQLKEQGIEIEFKYNKDTVIGVEYKYQGHSYKGASLDHSLSFNLTKEQLVFPDVDQLKLRKYLLDNIQSGKPIKMNYDGKRVVFSGDNLDLNRRLQALPQKEAIDLTHQFNGFRNKYEHADLNAQKLIRKMAEDNLDEYLQRRYLQQQKNKERRIRH